MEMNGLYLGIDVGSVSANTVILDSNRMVVEEYYTRTKGQPLRTVKTILEEILERIPQERFQAISLTGTGGKLLAELLGGQFINEIIAQAKAVSFLHPEVRTIIDMGGEDSKLILIDYDGADGHFKIGDFSMNTLCAAGTGSFLDQQATRLGLTIEEFGELALRSENPPRIAGRCSVFAKTDMIHLQQIATPDYDIVAGLCFALARNFKSNIARGRSFVKPVSFQGGVAANLGMKRAFLEVLDLREGELIIPRYFASMGAIGAVLMTMEDDAFDNTFISLEGLEDYLNHHREERANLEKLALSENHLKAKGKSVEISLKGQKLDAYLGLDVGSISTNLVVIDEEENVLSKRYLMTAGRPIEAVRTGLKEIGEEIGDRVWIRGCATTGSGRYLTADFVGADIVRNEITAQATASVRIDPTVDTIFEIGGQDSKYISLENGVVVDFEMNKVCAAGTGSFLEEQAEKLDISIKEEFGALALQALEPIRMGERCTVFIESDLVHHQQRGARTDDLVGGLSYSIVQNYLNRVVGEKRVGNRIFFQGGTAFNKGVVAAFEKWLGKDIVVPENHDVTGAIGAAILAKEEKTWDESTFKGFDLSERKYELTTFECKGCSNMCLIRKVSIEGEKPLFYGSRCEKYDVIKRSRSEGLPDIFAEREELLFAPYEGEEDLPDDAPVIGIPRILHFHELFPFWKAFFTELGYRIVLSDFTNKELIREGVETIVAETCFPIKAAHGHVLDLLKKGIRDIFIPSIINIKPPAPEIELTQTCPYVQSFPYAVKSSIDFERYGARVLQPIIHFGWGSDQVERELVQFGRELKRSSRKVKKAFARAEANQEKFYDTLIKRGEEILGGLKPGAKVMVIVGRPYNSCDSGINLEVPKKLREIGVLALPMDYLPLDSASRKEGIREMYWRYGQKILCAAHLIREQPNLYGVFISNFGCGADSFILHFFRDILAGKPFLQLEIDEHSADAGVITRCEAFLDSLKHAKEGVEEKVRKRLKTDTTKKIYIPYMCDHSYTVAAAFEACGISADVFPESDEETLFWGRKMTSGKECYPCTLTTGDMLKLVRDPNFDRNRAALFMPSGNGPCRFGQYNRFQRIVLDELGFEDVPIYSPNQDETLYADLGIMGSKFTRLGWQAIVAVDLLIKKLLETRPYERNRGETDSVYRKYLRMICETIKNEGDLEEVLREGRDKLDRIPVEAPGTKPLIGIVGEIYVRSNRFSNEDVIRKIEQFGGEAWLSPVSEWILYINAMGKRHSLRHKSFSILLKIILTDYYQKKDEHRLTKIFRGYLRNLHEPTVKSILQQARPYLHDSFEGEAVLSVGRTADFAYSECSGVVNVMPFTCMPGTIVSAILKRYREENNNFPVLNMVYDGQEQTNTLTRLEAFMYQARQYREKNLLNSRG
jgi:predicted CoA-substrate-specific enzyme activase